MKHNVLDVKDYIVFLIYYLLIFRIFDMKWENSNYMISIHPRETIVEERDCSYLSRTPEQRFFGVLQLNHVSITMNGGKPLKYQQGKGL